MRNDMTLRKQKNIKIEGDKYTEKRKKLVYALDAAELQLMECIVMSAA